MVLDELDVIGNKAIYESHGWQTLKNGLPYRNTYVILRLQKIAFAEVVEGLGSFFLLIYFQ